MRNFYKLCLFCCCSVFLVLSNNFTLVASHAKGADMTYKCISSGEYEITLVFYYDCSSTELPPTNVPLEFTSFTCNEYYTDFLFKIFAESEQEVSPLCPESLSQSQCSLGSLPGVKKHVYRRSFSLPQSCPDWIVSFTECCRNPQITNIPNPTDFQLHTEVWIDNSGNICNNSVQFENEPVSYYCNVPSSFEQFAIDPDGDSLVFNLMAPLNYISNPIPFAGAFNLLQPFNAQPFSFNTTNGALTFTPNGQQVAAVAVRVDEYRNGKWVGAVMRDMQLTVANCNNRQLQLTADVPETISVCVGEPVQINLTATDPDSADIPTLTYNEVQFDNASLTINSNAGGLLTAAFLWYPSPADTGIHKLVFRATDNACPFMSEDLFICNIFVNWQPFAGPDLFYCGSPLNVQVSGGGTFTWQPTTGLTLLNETGSSVSLAPTVTTTYTLSNNCSSTDQLTVQVLPDIPLSMPQNEEGCAGQPIQLLPNLPNAAAYSFQWLPAQGLNNPNILTPEASPSDTVVYFLTATDNATGCSVTDSVQVNIPGRLYGLDIASDDTLCSAALNQLNAVLYQRLEGGINTGGFVAQNAMLTVGHDTLSVNSPTPYNGSFENGRIQMLFRKDELLAEGIFPGTISQIGFYVTRKYSPIPYSGFTVKMGHTTDMVIGGFVSGLTTVAQASDYTTQPGWNMHPLDFPYDWDGNRNMLVEICFSNPDWFYRDDVAASTTNGNTVVYEEKDGIPVCEIGRAHV